jgi:single-stranded-DNA-specific exonuclease
MTLPAPIASLAPTDADPREAVASHFRRALAGFDPERPVAVLGHFDADGLSALAILCRALVRAGRKVAPHIVGKGENPWDEGFGESLPADLGGLILTDLGTRPDAIRPGLATLLIDHHKPTGMPADADAISGHGLVPEPTSALLAYWCARGLGEADDLLWLAAMGLIGDMADGLGFPELAEAQVRYGKTALKDAVSLVNAPRRTAQADASPALALLMQEDGPKAITKGDRPEVTALRAAKAEVAAALDGAKRVPPRINGDVALIAFSSPCQIHPLIAQQWRGRLKDKIVLAANSGYRAGWVHFAARTATGRDLIAFLGEHRPAGADGHYGHGHLAATGGALRVPQWNAFVDGLGFPEAAIGEPPA